MDKFVPYEKLSKKEKRKIDKISPRHMGYKPCQQSGSR